LADVTYLRRCDREPSGRYLIPEENSVSALATRCTLGLLLLAAALGLAACKDVPGADGRYATHDRGYNNRGP
jgi:hypothetical protein